MELGGGVRPDVRIFGVEVAQRRLSLQHLFRLRHNVGPAHLRQQCPNPKPGAGAGQFFGLLGHGQHAVDGKLVGDDRDHHLMRREQRGDAGNGISRRTVEDHPVHVAVIGGSLGKLTQPLRCARAVVDRA